MDYCENCKEEVYGRWEDNGIGPYEYWGSFGVQHDWVLVCPVCDEILRTGEEDCDRCY